MNFRQLERLTRHPVCIRQFSACLSWLSGIQKRPRPTTTTARLNTNRCQAPNVPIVYLEILSMLLLNFHPGSKTCIVESLLFRSRYRSPGPPLDGCHRPVHTAQFTLLTLSIDDPKSPWRLTFNSPCQALRLFFRTSFTWFTVPRNAMQPKFPDRLWP